MKLNKITDQLVEKVSELSFEAPVTHVYNPLEYARAGWDAYAERFGAGSKEVLLTGMNPGPFGMAQVGVPFGDIPSVRDWMGIDAEIGAPGAEHPKRPILGFGCKRREVSGTRLWGWAADRFGAPETFFDRFFVLNYCPLCFMEESGRNRTPDKLPVSERSALFGICDEALLLTAEQMKPRYVLGVGAFAEARIREALAGMDVVIGRIPHPSPANPAANRGWGAAADKALEGMGI